MPDQLFARRRPCKPFLHQPCLPIIVGPESLLPLDGLRASDAGTDIRKIVKFALDIARMIGKTSLSVQASAAALTSSNTAGFDQLHDMCPYPEDPLKLADAQVDPKIVEQVKTWWEDSAAFDIVLFHEKDAVLGEAVEHMSKTWGFVDPRCPRRIHLNHTRLTAPLSACIERLRRTDISEQERTSCEKSADVQVVHLVCRILHESQHSMRRSLFPKDNTPANLITPLMRDRDRQLTTKRHLRGEGGRWWEWEVLGGQPLLYDDGVSHGARPYELVDLVIWRDDGWFKVCMQSIDRITKAKSTEEIAMSLPFAPAGPIQTAKLPRTCQAWITGCGEEVQGLHQRSTSDEASAPRRGPNIPLVSTPNKSEDAEDVEDVRRSLWGNCIRSG